MLREAHSAGPFQSDLAVVLHRKLMLAATGTYHHATPVSQQRVTVHLERPRTSCSGACE